MYFDPRSWLRIGATIAAVSIAVAATGNAETESPEARLAAQVDRLAAEGYKVIERATKTLQKGKDVHARIQLERGATYALIAACGKSCRHVEVELRDGAGTFLYRTPHLSDVVAVGGRPQTKGLHGVVISAPGCDGETCGIAYALMRDDALGLPAIDAKERDQTRKDGVPQPRIPVETYR